VIFCEETAAMNELALLHQELKKGLNDLAA